MTRLQFIALLTPAIGSFVLVILAWLHSNSRLSDLRSAMNDRFEAVNRQFDEVYRKFDEVYRKFDEVYRNFDEVSRRLGLIEADQKQFYAVTGKLDGRLDEISKK